MTTTKKDVKFTDKDLKRMKKDGINPDWVRDYMNDKRGSMEDAISLAKKLIPGYGYDLS